MGESEKLVANLFKMAPSNAPSIIFIYEIATLRSQREKAIKVNLLGRSQLLVQMQYYRRRRMAGAWWSATCGSVLLGCCCIADSLLHSLPLRPPGEITPVCCLSPCVGLFGS